MLTKATEEQIKSSADNHFLDIIREFIELKPAGSGYAGRCPFCQAEKKFTVSPSKGIYKCFSCDNGGKGLISFIQDHLNKSYPETLEYLADKFNIVVEREKAIRNGSGKQVPFRDLQLKASGLTKEDQRDKLQLDDETEKEIDRYEPATKNSSWEISDGDDMILHYLDLEGRAMTYTTKNNSKSRDFIRVRYQMPDLHKNVEGRPKKYDQPPGSGSHLWINKWIRNKYKAGSVIHDLFIQEGEKKTDKATKHGINSVGILGIHNLGSNNQLPKEFELIIKKNQVKNIALVFDSDWQDLGKSTDKAADSRAATFLAAIRNFRDYFYAFHGIGIYLETFIVAINKNEQNEKGIDDLLSGSLAGKEDELKADIEKAMQSKDGIGKYVTAFRITGKSEYQLRAIMHMNSPVAFIEYHKEKLKALKYFKLNKIEWKYNEEKKEFELAVPLTEDEKFWKITENEMGMPFYKFSYMNCYQFLKNNFFGRYHINGNKFRLVKIDGKVVKEMEAYQVKDYVVNFTKAINEPEVVEMLYRGARMYLGADSLGNLDYIKPKFVENEKNGQYFFFRDKYCHVTDTGIKTAPINELQGNVWENKIIDFVPDIAAAPIVTATRITEEVLQKMDPEKRAKFEPYRNQYSIDLTDQAMESHFYQFLERTSNFHWRKPELSIDEQSELNLHIVSKMTAIGYLLHQFRNPSVQKAAIAMDGKISAVGESHGRTGKSLLGTALEKMVPTHYIAGKKKDLTEDKYIFGGVDERTQLIWIDDVRVNFDFEFLFPIITGKIQIEVKGVQKYSLPEGCYPKLYIPTNHAINGEGGSYTGRQALIAFSDYYYYLDETNSRQPVDEFKMLFFDEWDYNQWNLFYNLMFACMHMYFKLGIVSPPTQNLEKRRLRQQIGEQFIEWADMYFERSSGGDATTSATPNMNQRLERKQMYNDFAEEFPNLKKFVDPREFKKRLIHYCKYKGLIFNPGKSKDGREFGGDDKSNGIEYFTVNNG